MLASCQRLGSPGRLRPQSWGRRRTIASAPVTLIGVPVVFLVVAGMVLLGGGDRVAALAVGAWISLFGGGTFFGAIGFIAMGSHRSEAHRHG